MNVWIAASDGNIQKVEEYFSEGFGPESKDPNGYTPIHAAASYGHVDMLRKLCSEPYNGSVNVRDNDGDTPLHHCEDLAAAKVILEELGGNFKLTNNDGNTALEVLEEDQEFPDLIQYLRGQSGVAEEPLGIDSEQMAQFKDNLRYTLENEPETNDPESAARRQRIEQILDGGNPEQELEQYIRDLVRSQWSDQGAEPDTKRRRE
ncbi:LANO_0A01970g1_1 [Lachancea nothofagi CBS 11611]|uniref:LANO_0A01970g1_1 n=1 Tax=Lachancea nothofagi CBS 11611 TaxID=1266666 RepID=A0A1G4IN19_9SACH|nr:LANO_0A01970g1_1 [Lachancea nothofagi CBS 11611]